MTDQDRQRRVHDVGGTQAGEVHTHDAGVRPWQQQATALRIVATARNVVRADELRRATEDLGTLYRELGYFDRATRAMRDLLVEKGIVTEAEVDEAMVRIREGTAAADGEGSTSPDEP